MQNYIPITPERFGKLIRELDKNENNRKAFGIFLGWESQRSASQKFTEKGKTKTDRSVSRVMELLRSGRQMHKRDSIKETVRNGKPFPVRRKEYSVDLAGLLFSYVNYNLCNAKAMVEAERNHTKSKTGRDDNAKASRQKKIEAALAYWYCKCKAMETFENSQLRYYMSTLYDQSTGVLAFLDTIVNILFIIPMAYNKYVPKGILQICKDEKRQIISLFSSNPVDRISSEWEGEDPIENSVVRRLGSEYPVIMHNEMLKSILVWEELSQCNYVLREVSSYANKLISPIIDR